MLQAHQSREKAIKKCVAEVSSTVDKLREQKEKDSDNLSLNTSLRQEQYKVCLHISRFASQNDLCLNWAIVSTQYIYLFFVVASNPSGTKCRRNYQRQKCKGGAIFNV